MEWGTDEREHRKMRERGREEEERWHEKTSCRGMEEQ